MKHDNWHKELGGEKNFSLILSKFKDTPNLEYLQIGVFVGHCSLWLLENVLTHETSRLTDLDCWDLPRTKVSWEEPWGKKEWLEVEKDYNDMVYPYKDKIIKVKDYTKNWLMSNRDKKYDFIYIDGDHSKKNILEDAILSWDLLKLNGILAFDDYLWFSPNMDSPKSTIDFFIEAYRDKIEIILLNNQVWLKKINDAIY